MKRTLTPNFNHEYIIIVAWLFEHGSDLSVFYSDINADYDKLVNWCKEQYGDDRNVWRVNPGAQTASFAFRDKSQAALFKLTWS